VVTGHPVLTAVATTSMAPAPSGDNVRMHKAAVDAMNMMPPPSGDMMGMPAPKDLGPMNSMGSSSGDMMGMHKTAVDAMNMMPPPSGGMMGVPATAPAEGSMGYNPAAQQMKEASRQLIKVMNPFFGARPMD